MPILDFIIKNIFRNPPILLGLIAMLGLLLQKKSFGEIVKGGFLAGFGMLILQIGTGQLVNAILPVNTAFGTLAQGGEVVKGVMDTATFTSKHGGDVGLAMFIGLIIHLLIARFTKIKVIFLTGHFLWWFPFIFVAVGVGSGVTGTNLIAFGAILSALYWSIVPWVLRGFVKDVTGDYSFTLGHPSGILAIIAGYIAKVVGNKSKSTEDINVPKRLSFFKEISITGALVMFIMFLVTGFTIPGAFKDQSLVMYSINQGIIFGVGLIIMLTGVRMLVNQLLPAFKGISDKLVPNSIPALDCPILFNYKPNAAMIGFVVAMIVSTIFIIMANVSNLFGVVLIPLVITSFFECGTAAVIAEGQGGLKGAIIGTAVAATVMVLLLGLSMIPYQDTIADWIKIFGGNDLSLWGIITKPIAKLLGGM